ncbi:MAG TPA: NrfD/PsrC family molybdoenzyme membrane anchor subunit [Gallionellaceae bacterium]|nr:NrfD/PsrC family molybdoenzyme membrane anchor subunit [Gallionellaceae bacterium]
MQSKTFSRYESRYFYALVALGALFVFLGYLAMHTMEEHGHIVTGMNNQIVWGIPHVFAIFMIVAASGVLNIGSIGTIFGQKPYKARSPLAGLVAIALLVGGLAVLMLDLGRPDRIIIAATHFNPTSVFAWNIFLYSGFFTLAALYLWTMLEKRMNVWSKPVGLAMFAWRVILTSGTGMIFAFLVVRQAYGSALLPPMFIVLSFAWGMAVFLVVQAAMYAWNNKTLDPAILSRMKNLLGLFVVSSLYLVAIYHMTNLYFAKQTGFEYFILRDGGTYPMVFWAGYVLLGSLLPLALIYLPSRVNSKVVVSASLLVIIGSFALLYVFILGGQAYPLSIFPGYEVSSSFRDGEIAKYAPSLPEIMLGVGGLAIAFLITIISTRVINSIPHDAAAVAKNDD